MNLKRELKDWLGFTFCFCNSLFAMNLKRELKETVINEVFHVLFTMMNLKRELKVSPDTVVVSVVIYDESQKRIERLSSQSNDPNLTLMNLKRELKVLYVCIKRLISQVR